MEESQDSNEYSSRDLCNQDAFCKCPINKIYKEQDKADCPYMATMNTENILVRNPYNGELINARPFFELLNKHYNGDLSKYAKKIDEEIRLLVECLPNDSNLTSFKNILADMYDRRDRVYSSKVSI